MHKGRLRALLQPLLVLLLLTVQQKRLDAANGAYCQHAPVCAQPLKQRMQWFMSLSTCCA
jgi:hypothetical protein